MNSFVSLISAGGKAAAPAVPSDLALPLGPAKTSFSSVLERSLEHSPERQSLSAKSSRSRSEQAGDSREKETLTGHRSPVREERRRKEDAADQSLAGACAVSGSVMPPEEPAQVEAGAEGASVAIRPASIGTTESESASVEVTSAPGGRALATIPGAGSTVAPQAAQPGNAAASESGNLISMLTPTELSEGQSTIASLAPVAPEPTNATAANPVDQPGTGVEMSLITELNAIIERELSASPESDVPANARPTSALVGADTQEPAASGAGVESTIENAPEVMANIAAALPVSPEEMRRTVRAARLFRGEPPENPRGMAGAQPSSTMKTTLRKEEIAGGGGQLLPGSSTAVSLTANPPGEVRRSAGGVVSSEIVLDASRLAAVPVRADLSETSQPQEARATSPLLRVSELISREVRMFKRGGDELVEVVLTPDVKTQISLRLQWREGQVEVQARCDFGDYRSLNTEWSQLQASLATHGVRLSHLSERTPTGFTEFFNHPNFSQQQQQSREQQKPGDGSPAGNLAPKASGDDKSAPTPVVSRINRLFDFWA